MAIFQRGILFGFDTVGTSFSLSFAYRVFRVGGIDSPFLRGPFACLLFSFCFEIVWNVNSDSFFDGHASRVFA